MTKDEQQEQITHALKGAAVGIAAAVENEEITPIQIYSLLSLIVQQLQATLH